MRVSTADGLEKDDYNEADLRYRHCIVSQVLSLCISDFDMVSQSGCRESQRVGVHL